MHIENEGRYEIQNDRITHKKMGKVLLADAENYYRCSCQKRSSKKTLKMSSPFREK